MGIAYGRDASPRRPGQDGSGRRGEASLPCYQAKLFQLPVEALARHRDGGADFLREQGHLVFLHHPAVGLEVAPRFEASGWPGFEFPERFHVRAELLDSFLVFGRVQGRSFHADEQCLEVAGQVRQALIRETLQEPRRDQAD